LGEQNTEEGLLQRIMEPLSSRQIRVAAKNFVLPVSFILPIAILYISESPTFEEVWKGRAPYLIFLWLFFLEFVLGVGKLPKNMIGTRRVRTIIALCLLAIPIGYAIGVSLFGFSSYVNFLSDFGKFVGVPYAVPEYKSLNLPFYWALSVEYLFFTVIFVASIVLVYGSKGLNRFPVSLFMIAMIGSAYMIDTFYPYGTLAMFQNLVEPTASSTTFFLNLMGYKASWYNTVESPYGVKTILKVSGGRYYIGDIHLYWPCAGIQSLFIYTFAILLFIRGAGFSLKRKIIYFAVGAVGTFFVNVLRIVSIIVIGLNSGPAAFDEFHRYYGEFYFIAWILLYPLAIIYGRSALTKLFKLVLRAATRLYKEILTLIQRMKTSK